MSSITDQSDQALLSTSIETLLSSPVPIKAIEAASCSQKPPKLKTEVTIKSETSSKANTCRVCLQDGNIPIYGNEVYSNVSEELNTFADINVRQDDEYPKHLCENCNCLLRSAMQLRMTAQYSDQILRDLVTHSRSPSPVIIDEPRSESPDSLKLEIEPKSTVTNTKNSTVKEPIIKHLTTGKEINISDAKLKLANTKNANNWTDKEQIIKDLTLGKEIKIEHVVIKKTVNKPTEPTTDKLPQISLIKRKVEGREPSLKELKEQLMKSRMKRSLKKKSLKHKKVTDRKSRTKIRDMEFKPVIIAESIIIPGENSPRISLLQNKKKKGESKSIRGDIINPLTSPRISLLKPKKEKGDGQSNNYINQDIKNKELNIIDPAYAPQRISLLKKKQSIATGVSNEERAKLKIKRKRGTNCALCDIKFQTKEELEQHLESEEHKSHKNKKECPICHKHYGLQYFKTHMEFHNEGTSYICDICGKEFKTKLLCEGHRRRHNVKLTFKCSICPYRHYTRHAVKKHEKTHLQQKTSQCPECFKCFSNNSNMNTHLRRHKEPEFKCDMCNKGFYYKKFLQEHIRSDHLGIKDHICEICGKAFGFRKPMMKHMLKVHKRQKLRQGVIPLYLLPEHQNDMDTSEPELPEGAL